MANIRKELGRHRWQFQILDKSSLNPEGVKGFLCTNCKIGWDPSKGDQPVTGCLSDIDVKLVGPARQKDYFKQDEVIRKERLERDAAFERHKEDQYNAYVRERQRHHR